MLKKVKSKHYKSKREFKDDLELIWSNCLTYNAAENHPLRPCVKRLKLKADRLLKYITDRKERADPPIPSDISATHIARPKVNGNGQTNGRLSHHRSPSIPTIFKSVTPTANIKLSPSQSAKHIRRRDAPFSDTPAITRTPAGMALFSCLDRNISEGPEASSSSKTLDTPSLVEELQELAGPVELPSGPDSPPSEDSMLVDEVLGDKRKLDGFVNNRPRKRARYSSQYATPVAFEKDEVSELWWGAVQSDTLLANGIPEIPFASSSSSLYSPSSSRPAPVRKAKPKRRREKAQAQAEILPPKSLLALMNNNIKTMKRLRHTHAKFVALTATTTGGEDGEGAGGDAAAFSARGASPNTAGTGASFGTGEEEGIEAVDDKVDDRPWNAMVKGKRRVRGVEIGEENAEDCLKWMSGKMLEHAGFQGELALPLRWISFGLMRGGAYRNFAGRLGSAGWCYIGVSIQCWTDDQVPEIILHTLFESGTSKIQDLERYISDDVERYGSRLLDLEKKLVSAYRESSAVEVLEDEGLFEEEDEEEAGALAMGDFADALGEDYLGLRELGIAAEFGMSSLSIPKKLLKGKKAQKLSSATAKPTEPPPPYPPPPPFVPFTANKVDDQIGLLKAYYRARFDELAARLQPPPPPPAPTNLPGPALGSGHLPGPTLTLTAPHALAHPPPPPQAYGMPPYPPVTQDLKSPALPTPPPTLLPPPPPPESLVLPDDAPNPLQVKIAPLGQITKGGASAATSKKKKEKEKEKEKAAAASGAGAGAEPPKKKKQGMVGVGTGNGRKKKVEADAAAAAAAALVQGVQYPAPPPPVAAAGFALPLGFAPRMVQPPSAGQ
ncbi:hypothetical protein DXG03_001357 [Asterophora parasitica]|uniref:Bromo domain-containing protein n=1 Tax=Asterophora parasitica TaxID=117018 RepID=A0A9P7G9Y3_9AGAR|nr:hypothetical protein DXG03_001357 [Asterophora parasitica]